MLRRCTKRSLLLVDEFGKGTAPADGMALLAAMIESIVEEPNPLFMVSTHFLEIFEMKLLDSATDAKLRKFRMDFILPKEKKTDQKAQDVDINDTSSPRTTPLFAT